MANRDIRSTLSESARSKVLNRLRPCASRLLFTASTFDDAVESRTEAIRSGVLSPVSNSLFDLEFSLSDYMRKITGGTSWYD